MEQLTKNQAVATSQEAVQNQNEPQLRDENAHNDKSVHGVLNPTYHAGFRRDAVQPDIEAERKKRDEIEAGKFFCCCRFRRALHSFPTRRSSDLELFVARLHRRGDRVEHGHRQDPGEERRSEEHTSELQSQSNLVCRLLLEKKKYDATPFNQILKQNAKREMRLRL